MADSVKLDKIIFLRELFKFTREVTLHSVLLTWKSVQLKVPISAFATILSKGRFLMSFCEFVSSQKKTKYTVSLSSENIRLAGYTVFCMMENDPKLPMNVQKGPKMFL